MALWKYQGILRVTYHCNSGMPGIARGGDLEAVLRCLQWGQHESFEGHTFVQATDSPDGVLRTYELELTIQADSDLSGLPTQWNWGQLYGVQPQLGEQAMFIKTVERQKLSDPDAHPWQ